MLMMRTRNPLASVSAIQNELDRFFNGFANSSNPANVPDVNVWETSDSFFVEAEVPGLKLDDLDISILGDELNIKGHRKFEKEDDAKFIRRERRESEFTRVLKLPGDIDGEKVSATLEHGVLTLELPKAAEIKPRKISVKST